MASDNHKPIISVCPFQTQLVVTFPTTGERIIAGSLSAPQILKVQCDKENCQLWDSTLGVCSVSVPVRLCTAIRDGTDDLSAALRDINATLGDIKKHMATWLPTPG